MKHCLFLPFIERISYNLSAFSGVFAISRSVSVLTLTIVVCFSLASAIGVHKGHPFFFVTRVIGFGIAMARWGELAGLYDTNIRGNVPLDIFGDINLIYNYPS